MDMEQPAHPLFSPADMALAMAAASKKIKLENLLLNAPQLLGAQHQALLGGIDTQLLQQQLQQQQHSPMEPGLKSEGTGQGYFSCGQCQKVFWSESSLKHHSSLYHSEKAFVCEICGKAFRFRSNLAEHRSVHTSLKPYVCKFCGKSSRLKGNLTKHILKHHKKEQNAYIGKDDIIIKKGKKSVKDPVAVDFLEKSMIVLPENTRESPSTNSAALQLFTMAQLSGPQAPTLWTPENDNGAMEQEQTSSGSENGLRISTSPEPKSSVASSPARKRPYPEDDVNNYSPNTNDVADSPGRDQSLSSSATATSLASTKCGECGKCFRKATALHVHMSLKHPSTPLQALQLQRQNSNDDSTNSTSNGVSSELREIRGMLAEGESGRLDATLSSLDQRVARLERQVESSLASLGSLVQLQGGMNAAFARFRDEVAGQLKSLQGLILASGTQDAAPPSAGHSEHSASSDE